MRKLIRLSSNIFSSLSETSINKKIVKQHREKRNRISQEENDIDIALKRLMYARFKLGMFDDANNVPFSKKPMTLVGSTEHLKLTEEAAQK